MHGQQNIDYSYTVIFSFECVSDNIPQTQISQKRLSYEHHSKNEKQKTKSDKPFMYILKKMCSVPTM
jgi:hypothetical protein